MYVCSRSFFVFHPYLSLSLHYDCSRISRSFEKELSFNGPLDKETLANVVLGMSSFDLENVEDSKRGKVKHAHQFLRSNLLSYKRSSQFH